MVFAVLFLALLTIALSAYFLPKNGPSGRNIQEGTDVQVLDTKEGKGGEDTKTKIPVSVNYHLTRQCNYSCGLSHLPLIRYST